MSEIKKFNPNDDCHSINSDSMTGSGHYEIKVKGLIDAQWSDWFGDLKVIHDECGDSTLSGSIVDQSALHGILAQIRDLGLTLVSVTRRDTKDGC